MSYNSSQRLLYTPVDPHQAGTAIWLISRYKKQDPDRKRPHWVQWLRIRDAWMVEQETIHGKNNLTCAICGKTELHAFTTDRKKQATIDHILPVSKYPDLWNVRSNFQVACVRCNQKKGNRH